MRHTKIERIKELNFITLDQAKRQLDIIDSNEDDLLIGGYTLTAMELSEKATSRLLSESTVTMQISGSLEFTLPYGEIDSITSVQVDGNDVSYDYNDISEIMTITSGNVTCSDKIVVTYIAGFKDPEKVPQAIQMGAKMLISSMYENRGDVVTGITVNDIPLNSKALFDSCKLEWF